MIILQLLFLLLRSEGEVLPPLLLLIVEIGPVDIVDLAWIVVDEVPVLYSNLHYQHLPLVELVVTLRGAYHLPQPGEVAVVGLGVLPDVGLPPPEVVLPLLLRVPGCLLAVKMPI